MLHGVDTFTLSTGTVCTVEWTRPEVGVDITEEEQKTLMRKFANTWLKILIENCNKLLDDGKPEAAEKRWRETGIDIPPPWLENND